jgi:hypothetical protein
MKRLTTGFAVVAGTLTCLLRPSGLDRLADPPAPDRRERHRVHPHPGGLYRGQHHLARHLRGDDVFLTRVSPSL